MDVYISIGKQGLSRLAGLAIFRNYDNVLSNSSFKINSPKAGLTCLGKKG